jgi:hypothetical protein
MALARCESCGCPRGLKQDYVYFHAAASPLSRNVLCGSPTCARPASLWLTDEEEQQYLGGQRIFRVSNRNPDVQVT